MLRPQAQGSGGSRSIYRRKFDHYLDLFHLPLALLPGYLAHAIGRDKFAVLLKNSDAEREQEAAERLRAAVEALELEYQGQCLRLTNSIGGTAGHPKSTSEVAENMAHDETIERRQRLFTGPPMIRRYCAGQPLSKPELDVVDEVVAEWRQRLIDISWFMRCVNEHIARTVLPLFKVPTVYLFTKIRADQHSDSDETEGQRVPHEITERR